jgi:hypothetical protein
MRLIGGELAARSEGIAASKLGTIRVVFTLASNAACATRPVCVLSRLRLGLDGRSCFQIILSVPVVVQLG